MLRVKLEEEVYDLPQSWKEVTVKQFVDLSMYKEGDIIALLAIMLQASYDKVFAIDDASAQKIIDNMAWYYKEFDFEALDKPKTISIKGTRFNTPDDIQLKTYGQKIHFEILMKSPEDAIMKMAHTVGIYMYPIVSGEKFDDEPLNDFVNKDIMRCSIVEVYPLAAFFLNSWIPSSKRKTKLLLRNMTKTKNVPVLEVLSNLE